MRTKEDNLLKIATAYEASLIADGFYDEFSDTEFVSLFQDIIKDYRKMVRACVKDGVDAGGSEEEAFNEQFTNAVDIVEKASVLKKINEEIMFMIDACENIPVEIEEKYGLELSSASD